jgi:hypothetical protein
VILPPGGEGYASGRRRDSRRPNRPNHGGDRAGTGRAVELACEVARAEGASLPATGRGQAVK